MKALIVDDDVDILKLLEDILLLKFPSIKLATAKNGVEALDLLKGEKDQLPQIVLSDMKMPVMNGAEFCKIVKSTYGRSIKVALMTAFNETSGCFDEIFFKPIDFDALFNFIRNNWA
jgi:CheY-like chemotaxis protein